MTDSSPTPPKGQDPSLDPADDTDEPAFEWMKPASADPRPAAEPSRPSVPDAASPAGAAAAAAPRQPESRADRKAAEAGVEPAPSTGGAPFREPLATSALQVRPPEEEVQRRNAEREQAAKARPVAPRVMQVLLAVCFPVILLVLAVRAVASPLFLWVEYNRPGFPGDGYGFSTDDRMTYGSYAVDYLSNWAGPRYLGELVNRSGDQLFGDGEVSHMADVKLVMLSAFGAGAVLILVSLIAAIYLRRRSPGGVRRGLFAGSVIALAVILSLGVLAVLGWEQFFAQFHSVFFASGTWTFALQDTLIRLFPGQFWVDGGIAVAGLVLLASLVTLIFTWPTRKRRGLPKRGSSKEVAAEKDGQAAEDVDPDPADGSAGRPETAAAGAVPARTFLSRRDRAAKTGSAGAATGTASTGTPPVSTGTASASDPGPADPGSRDTPSRGHSSAV